MDDKNKPVNHDRSLPHSVNIEACILSAFMLSSGSASKVYMVKEEMFYTTSHKIIYRAIEKIVSKGDKVDTVIVYESMSNKDRDRIGGLPYLSELMSMVVSDTNLDSHIKTLIELSCKRQLIIACDGIINEVYSGEVGLAESAKKALDSVTNIITGSGGTEGVTFSEATSAILSLIDDIVTGKETYVKTGFFDLDKLTGGFNMGAVVILAARPAMGKTTFALAIALNCATNGIPTEILSFEQPRNELTMRMMSKLSREPITKIIRGLSDIHPDYLDDEIKLLAKSIDDTGIKMQGATLNIVDKIKRDIGTVVSTIMRDTIRYGIRVFFIDYLQLLTKDLKTENRTQELSYITATLKTVSKMMGVVIIPLSQLNRDLEKRSEKRPILADLRDSGSIEQDADLVMFLYVDEKYDPNTPDINIMEVIVAKNRHGGTGTVRLGVVFEHYFIGNLEERFEEQSNG